jgi:signal transduction histidine kinase
VDAVGAEAHGARRTGVPFLAVLGLVAVGACVLVAVTTLTDRRIDVERQTARAAAEHQGGVLALALRDVEASVDHLDPAACSRTGPDGTVTSFDTVTPRAVAAPGTTLWCVPAGSTSVEGIPVDLADPGVQVALAQSRDLGRAVLSAPSADAAPVVAGPIYTVRGEASLLPSTRQVEARRAELAGHVVAVVDVAALLDEERSWLVTDGATVLARTGDGGDMTEIVHAHALDRRWTVSTVVPGLGWWRPSVVAVAGLGLIGAVALGLADRQRRRAADADLDSMRRAERRAAAIRTLTGIVQNSQDLDLILPALAVQLSDELGLDGLSLDVAGADGRERAIFTHGVRPDPAVHPGEGGADVSAGSTVAVDLHRGARSIAVLRAVAGRRMDGEDLELLEVTGEMITSTIVSGRSLEQQQEAVARLEALDELKTTFLGVASHELRTPATAISGLASLLASRWDALREEDRRAFATRIATNADALNALVQDLLDFARLERGDLRLALAPVDLDITVERVLARLDSVWGSHSVLRSVEPGVQVLGDVNAIERILTNLVSNAVKFSPADADVQVLVESRDGRARLVVDDSGPGVPPEEREKIFVRFFRGTGDEVVRTRGVGIGLSVVQDFVAQMGGSVHVEDSPAGGARFVVELDVLDRSTVEERDAATT